MKIGLTGGIASGKNYIAKLFEKKGCYTLDADEISRIVMRSDGIAFSEIVNKFGESILSDGEISRKKLRQAVIADSAKRKELERIVHPAISQYARKQTGLIRGKDDKAIVIYHAPLLLEAGNIDYYDAIIVIYCSHVNQLARLKKRGYPPYEDAIKLMDNQMSYEEKLKYADFVINNDGTAENAVMEVDRVYNLLKIFCYAE